MSPSWVTNIPFLGQNAIPVYTQQRAYSQQSNATKEHAIITVPLVCPSMLYPIRIHYSLLPPAHDPCLRFQQTAVMITDVNQRKKRKYG